MKTSNQPMKKLDIDTLLAKYTNQPSWPTEPGYLETLRAVCKRWLNASDMTVLSVLHHFAEDGVVTMPMSSLVFYTNRNIGTIRRCIRDIEAVGLISVMPRPKQSQKPYTYLLKVKRIEF